MAINTLPIVAPIAYADGLMQDIWTAHNQERPLPIVENKEKLLRTVRSMEQYLHNGYANVFWKPAIAYLRNQPDWIFEWINMRPSAIQQSLAGQARLDCYHQILTTQTIAQVLLQRCDRTFDTPTRATQQIVCDMWNTFKQKSTICPYKPLFNGTNCQPPILVWSNDGEGAKCFSRHYVSSNASAELSIPIVYLPSGYSNGGVLGLTALGHEVAHAILETEKEGITRLTEEMGRVIAERGIRHNWQYEVPEVGPVPRASEMVADVMDVLYFGPTAAIGQLLSFRAFRNGKLSNTTPTNDSHPSDIQRGLVMMVVVRRLQIPERIKEFWVEKIWQMICEDYEEQKPGPDIYQAYDEARIVANVLLDTKIIGGKSLFEIHAWEHSDESYVQQLQGLEARSEFINLPHRSAHLLAAAVQRLTNGESLGIGWLRARMEFRDLQNRLIKEKERLTYSGICPGCDLSDPRPTPPKEVKAVAGPASRVNDWTAGDKVAVGLVLGAAFLGIGSFVFSRRKRQRVGLSLGERGSS